MRKGGRRKKTGISSDDHFKPLFPEGLISRGSGQLGARGRDPFVRQEVLNVLVAQLLQERGLIAVPEQIITPASGSRRMPDVLVDFQGLRLVIEGEFASTQAEQKASKAALRRVEEGIAHIGMALIYPASLRSVTEDIHELKRALAEAWLHFAVITEREATQEELAFPYPVGEKKEAFRFVGGDLNALENALRRSYDQLVKDEVLERAVNHLQQGIEGFISSLLRQPATTDRFASVLGIRELPKIGQRGTKKADE